jgi:hypothetical protein
VIKQPIPGVIISEIPNIDLPIINPLVSVTDTLGIHIPHSIKLKIWNCEYVQLEKMLDNDNTQLENEHKLVIIGGQITFKPQKMIKQKFRSHNSASMLSPFFLGSMAFLSRNCCT